MIKDDSRKIKKGDTFIALKKYHDGHDYIENAIKNGASKIIAEKGNYSVETLIVEDTHQYLVNYLKENYYEKIKDLKLIGMTGTNGKTTTCFLIYQALNKAGIKCAYIGTIGFYIEDKIKDLNNTTPDILEMYELLLECRNRNVEYVVLEASSQALDMHRLDGLKFEYGIFSNLTQDHLDYHLTIDNYIKSKQILFDKVTNKTFVNMDDKYKDYFIRNNTITYGINNSDYHIDNYDITIEGSDLTVNGIQYKTKLIGKHNLYNILVVIALLNELKINNISEIIKELNPPKGRMDIIRKNNNLVIVDYAHTPDAVSKIIESVRELNPNKIVSILGCGGDRDKTKRPIMASVACDLSDQVIFTNDNPRTENPNNIIADMLHNLDKFNYEIILNRKKAIIKGVQMLNKNDILLILGKGHENYQIIGNIKYDFDDKEVVIDI